MSIYIGWEMGVSERDLWAGEVLVQGLSDTLSEQAARMRCLVRASELLGAYATPDQTSVSLSRRMLLVGCRVERDAEGATVVLSSGLSKPVVLKPCGGAEWRDVFHLAVGGACTAVHPLDGLAMVTLAEGAPPQLCTLTLTANKQRPILQLQPVTVVGLEERARPPAPRSPHSLLGLDDDEGEEWAALGSAEAEAEAEAAAAAAAAALPPQLCGKVVAAKDPATGEPLAPLYYKLVPESALTEGAGGALELSNTRSIFRAQVALGLLSYKGQGPWGTLRLRAVDLERDDDAALFLPKPRAPPPPPPTFFAALVGGASPTASEEASAEASAAAAAEAGPPPVTAPVLEPAELLAGVRSLLTLLASAQSVVELQRSPAGSS